MSAPRLRFRRAFPLLPRRMAPARSTSIAMLLIDPWARTVSTIPCAPSAEAALAVINAPPQPLPPATACLVARLRFPPSVGGHVLISARMPPDSAPADAFELMPHGGIFSGRALLAMAGPDGALTDTTLRPERLQSHIRWCRRDAEPGAERDGQLQQLIQQIDLVIAERAAAGR